MEEPENKREVGLFTVAAAAGSTSETIPATRSRCRTLELGEHFLRRLTCVCLPLFSLFLPPLADVLAGPSKQANEIEW